LTTGQHQRREKYYGHHETHLDSPPSEHRYDRRGETLVRQPERAGNEVFRRSPSSQKTVLPEGTIPPAVAVK
jgi:hypothetical protein